MDIIDKLKEKYNYSEELCVFLEKAIPAILSYYGEDKQELLEKTLLDTEIHLQEKNEKTKDYLNEYFDTDKEWKIPTIATAFQHREIFEEDNTYHSKSIIYVRKTNINEEIDLENKNTQSIIIHEICHAIKTKNELEENNGLIVNKTGLCEEKYYIDETGEIKESGEDKLGLEEALNTHAEEKIMSIMNNEDYKTTTYSHLLEALDYLLEDKELEKLFIEGQFSDSTEWIDYLGEDYNKIVDGFDSILSVYYLPTSIIINKEKRQEAIAKRDQDKQELIDITKKRNKDKTISEMIDSNEETKTNHKEL